MEMSHVLLDSLFFDILKILGVEVLKVWAVFIVIFTVVLGLFTIPLWVLIKKKSKWGLALLPPIYLTALLFQDHLTMYIGGLVVATFFVLLLWALQSGKSKYLALLIPAFVIGFYVYHLVVNGSY